ncbi:hypothetical protein NBRC111894_914 [Sporolactobacillus inulinus]|uniref:Uncharacterized protein n=1 Tax=Sporolactobacillus inulinus TaxID=2078 RepID=A0A4Y1Z8Q6_9BACL|nr:hypothetical protein NBRC111894_914 [Sporolactobacillus inulinus]
MQDAEPAHQSGWNAHQAQDGSKPHPTEVRTKRSPVFLSHPARKPICLNNGRHHHLL